MNKLMVVDLASRRTSTLCAALHDAGMEVAGVIMADHDVAAAAERIQPDIIIVAAESCSARCIAQLEPLQDVVTCPVAVVLSQDDPKLLAAGIAVGLSVYVIESVSPALVRTLIDVTVMRHGRENELRDELRKLRKKLDKHQVVDRARCLLMERHGLTEKDAYQKLRKAAMNKGIGLVDVARYIMMEAA